jgi:hypothetical protein
METQPLERTITEKSIDYQSGDHERYSHYVNKNKIVESAVMGNAVEALCGKVWIPSRDPQKFPVCPTCQEIYEALKKD